MPRRERSPEHEKSKRRLMQYAQRPQPACSAKKKRLASVSSPKETTKRKQVRFYHISFRTNKRSKIRSPPDGSLAPVKNRSSIVENYETTSNYYYQVRRAVDVIHVNGTFYQGAREATKAEENRIHASFVGTPLFPRTRLRFAKKNVPALSPGTRGHECPAPVSRVRVSKPDPRGK